MHATSIQAPYLILVGRVVDANDAKTAFGLVQWCPEKVAGQLRLPGCDIDLGIPELSIDKAVAGGVRSMIIGATPVGGRLPDEWHATILDGLASGLNVVSGLHSRLSEVDSFVVAAQLSGADLIDVRVAPADLPIGSGKKRSGKRVLMVGTDCAVGKKYTALALTQALKESGLEATFRATGQTGIMIAGSGLAIDSVIADFISGAAELVSPANEQHHWDVIEGQGSLFNPGYAGVSLGLLHGSQPDALVMCHDASRTEIEGWLGFPMPSIADCMDFNLSAARLTNAAAQFVGISVNTSRLNSAERRHYIDSLTAQFDLPAIDPIIDGAADIAKHINQVFNAG